MDFKELLIRELNDMQKFRMEVFFSELFTEEEKRAYENELASLKEVLSYIGGSDNDRRTEKVLRHKNLQGL